MTPELTDAAARLLRLLETPQGIPALAPLIEREILYRLVCSEQTAILGQIAFAESRVHQLKRVIAWIMANYKAPFSMETAAAEASMSPSALYSHFKAVTTFSPCSIRNSCDCRRRAVSSSSSRLMRRQPRSP